MSSYKLPDHIRFLNMLAAVRTLSPFRAMTADEERLLEALLVKWHDQDRLIVSDVMRYPSFGSASSVYRRLVGLHKKGLVRLVSDAADKRIKCVEPTAQAFAFAERLRHCLADSQDQDRAL